MTNFSGETRVGMKESTAEALGHPDIFEAPARGRTALRQQYWPGEVTQEEKASLAGSW